MSLAYLCLKKKEDRRIRSGHPWIYSNEVSPSTPLKSFSPGEEVLVCAHDKTVIGVAYVNPHSLIAARLFTYNPDERLDISFFKNRIQEALHLRTLLYGDKPYYRLVYSEGDGLPGLIIDRFANDFVIQTNTAGMEKKIEIIAMALSAVVPELHSILLRNDSQIREHEQLPAYVKPLYGKPQDEIILKENGVRFFAPLQTGQKTGWFYDHRLNRARLKDYVSNQTVLDVFSYLGAFGIQAAHFGARHVDCIDASKTACEYISKNAKLNQVDHKINVIAQDAFDALKMLYSKEKRYDVITLDPPAFIKKAKDRKEGLIAYQRLSELALKLLNPNGILVFCSCSMHLSMEDLLHIMQRVAYRSKNHLQILERGHQAPDHPIHLSVPETDYLKALFVRKINSFKS